MIKVFVFKVLILIVLINTIYHLYNNNIKNNSSNLSPSFSSKTAISSTIKSTDNINRTRKTEIIPLQTTSSPSVKFFKNHVWMVNNNVIQYSSYVLRKIITRPTDLSIRTSIILDDRRLSKEEFDNSTYVCILKSLKTGEIIEIPTSEVISLIHRRPKKVYCNVANFQQIKIEDLLVAIIRVCDFRKTIDSKQWTIEKKVLPFYMINFQRPRIYDLPERKIKSVAMCTQFCYELPSTIKEWVKIHELLNVSQIILYDSTLNSSLTKLINRHNLNHIVEVRPYFLNETETCDLEKIGGSNDKDEIEAVLNMCNDFVKRIKFVRSYFHSRLIHDDTSANDCYTTEGEKYEFITVYDLDEMVLPRRFDQKDISLSCLKNPQTCSETSLIPFSLYDYSINLVEKIFRRAISSLNCIYFDSALYLPNDANIQNLIRDIKSVVSSYQNLTFPMNVYVSHGENKKHPFEIYKDDLDFIKNLVNEYETAECLYLKYKNILNDNFPNFSRFFYLNHQVKPGLQSPYKAIHFTDNIRAFYTHGAVVPGHYNKNSAYFHQSIESGHFLTHFRINPSEYFSNNINGSIRKLRIDKVYLNFLIKNFTNFCD